MVIFLRRVFILFSIAIIVSVSNAFSQISGDFKSPPAQEKENMQSGHRYYVGMPKDDLYKVYPPQTQKNDFKQGDEEWIVFDDIMTETDLQDIIAFYLRNDKVVGWDKKALPKTPDEMLKMIIARHGHSVGEPAYTRTDNGSAQKRAARDAYMESQRVSEIPVYTPNEFGESGSSRGRVR